MILADYVIWNTDRHLGSFGLIRNVETGKFTGFAPVFDCAAGFNEGSIAGSGKNNVFADQEERVIKEYGYQIPIKGIEEYDPMWKLIETYPGLTKVQKTEIKEGIRTRLKRI